MNPELKAKWVDALRSGKYKQGRIYLNSQGHKFCCLGVLCDISKMGQWVPEHDGNSRYVVRGNASGPRAALPYQIEDEYGDVRQGVLIDMNDDKRKSFAEIADYIEQNL